jgi:predicted nucleotide-binding protein
MARINQELLERLIAKLGVSRAQVYARIQKIANSKMLDRSHAALVLAAENNINIQRFSSPEDRAAIRGALNSGGNNGVADAVVPLQPVRHTRKKQLSKPSRAKDNSVFVVHGRDEGLRKSMFEFLRALSLNPMEWSKAVLLPRKGGANPHVDDILDAAMARVQAVVVIFSPDDLARLKESLLGKGEKRTEGKLQGQPRPNVIFEAGLALGRHPDKTLLVQIGSVRGFSDIAGKHLVRLTNDVAKRKDVANRLGKIGCRVDLGGDDWMTAGNFIPK